MAVRALSYRGVFVCGLVSLVSISLGFGPREAQVSPFAQLPTVEKPAESELILGQVVRVLDGDTILVRIGKRTLRYQLWGVDAPEFDPKDRSPDPYSVSALRFIKQLLLDEWVYIQHDPIVHRDTSGRFVGYVFRAPDMLFVNMELVRQGYAKYDPHDGLLYMDAFEAYESRAKQLRRGIWSLEAIEIIDWSTPFDESMLIPKEQETALPAEKSESIEAALDPDSTVYITKSGAKYHIEGCPHLTKSQRTTTRKEVEDTHKPCKTCRPDEVLEEN